MLNKFNCTQIKSLDIFLFSCICIFFTSTSAAQSEDKSSWKIYSEQAKCFIENLAAYQGSDSEPVVIFLKACPIVDRKAALAKLQVNTGVLPTVKIISDIDDVIRYDRKDLACLSDLKFDLASPIVELPANPCNEK